MMNDILLHATGPYLRVPLDSRQQKFQIPDLHGPLNLVAAHRFLCRFIQELLRQFSVN